MFNRFQFHGLMVAEWVGFGACVEALLRFIHGPHVVPAMNALAALLVGLYTHAVRKGRPSPPAIDPVELARLVAAELRPERPKIHEPEKPAAVPFVEPVQAGELRPCDVAGCFCVYRGPECPACKDRRRRNSDPDGRQATRRLSDLMDVAVVPGVDGVAYVPPRIAPDGSFRLARPAPPPEKPA